MAIRKSSSSGTPFGNTAGRPASPTVGQTYYNGTLGYLEIYTESGWIPATGANDFSLNMSGTNTTITFTQSYAAGSYSIVSFGNDLTLDVYAYAADGSVAGYTNSKSFTATQRFNKMVILGGTSGDVISFSYKTTYATSASTTDLTAGPYITSVTPSGVPNQNDTITIAGGNFASDVAVTFTGTGYSATAAKSVVRSSSTSLLVTRPDNLPVSGSPYTVTVSNPGVTSPTGSSVHQYSPITAGSVPVWQTSSTINSTFYANVSGSITLSATDVDGSSNVTYSYVSGTLPTGLSFNAATGIISGTGTVQGQSTTYTVRATDSGGNTADRTFTVVVSFPQITGGTLSSDSTYYYRTFIANGTLSVNGNLSSADILSIAGGGAGGAGFGTSACGGGGGAGGLLYNSSVSLPNNNYTVTVGAGGAPASAGAQSPYTTAVNGTQSSLIGGNVSIGPFGGGGGSSYPEVFQGGGFPSGSVGSGGGAGGAGSSTGNAGQSGTSGQGNNGGSSTGSGQSNTSTSSGGGGGAASNGGNGSSSSVGGAGGSGTNSYSSWITGISSSMTGVSGWSTATSGGFIAAGGGGGQSRSGSGANGGSGGGGASGAGPGSNGANNGFPGISNTGSGGGGASAGSQSASGGAGGSGIIIVRYTKASVGG
jgi:hypothetical protein